MQEWIRDTARKDGDVTSLKYTTKSTDKDGKETETLKGYYIVLYQGIGLAAVTERFQITGLQQDRSVLLSLL